MERTIQRDIHVGTTLNEYIGVVEELDTVILKLRLIDGTTIISPSGQTIKLYAKRPDNTIIEQTTQITTDTQYITIGLLDDILAVHGIVSFKLELTNTSGTVSSQKFGLKIKQIIYPSLSEDEIETLNNITDELTNLQTQISSNDNDILSINNKILNATNSYMYVGDYDIQEGFTVDIDKNTLQFQKMLDECDSDKVIVFPSGNYIFKPVDLGVRKNVTIVGSSSPFATFANKDITDPTDFIDKYTRIFCDGNLNETFFTHKSCVLILKNIAFYNTLKNEDGTYSNNEAKKLVLMQHVRSEDANKNVEKGKAFCTECAFYGFKVVFGSDFTFEHLEEELGSTLSPIEYEYYKQSCVLANRCRFTRNGIAINQSVDGRITDCSFNKNDYAIIFRENSGFTTVDSCRIEWNNHNGIYCDSAHDITISNCEFDCNGKAGLYAINNTNSNFINCVFRRNGASVETQDDESHKNDYVNNIHFYFNGNVNCNIIGFNTVVKPISDIGAAPERPSNCSNFTNNSNCIISLNDLNGCTKTDKIDANKIENNIKCIIDNNNLNGINKSDLSNNVFITLADYGVIGDGIVDDTLSMQKAIDDMVKKGIELTDKGNKIIKTTSPLYIRGAYKINLKGSTIKPITSKGIIIEMDEGTDEIGSYISHIKIDNNDCQVGLEINAKRTYTHHITVINNKGTAIQVVGGYENEISQCNLKGLTALNKGIVLSTTDNYVHHCYGYDIGIFFENNADGNFLDNCHSWCWTQTVLNGSIFANLNTSCEMSGNVIDTYEVGIKMNPQGTSRILANNFIVHTGAYNSLTSTKVPNFIQFDGATSSTFVYRPTIQNNWVSFPSTSDTGFERTGDFFNIPRANVCCQVGGNTGYNIGQVNSYKEKLTTVDNLNITPRETQVIKKDNRVILRGVFAYTDAMPTDYTTIYKIPDGLRPMSNVYAYAIAGSNIDNLDTPVVLVVDTNGNVNIKNASGKNLYQGCFNVSWDIWDIEVGD